MKQADLRDHGLVERHASELQNGSVGTIHRIVTAWEGKTRAVWEEKFFYVFTWRHYNADGSFELRQRVSKRFTSLGECRTHLQDYCFGLFLKMNEVLSS